MRSPAPSQPTVPQYRSVIHDPHTCNACSRGYNRSDAGGYAVMDYFVITDMDIVRAAIANAMAENMTIEDFDDAVNVLAQMMVKDDG